MILGFSFVVFSNQKCSHTLYAMVEESPHHFYAFFFLLLILLQWFFLEFMVHIHSHINTTPSHMNRIELNWLRVESFTIWAFIVENEQQFSSFFYFIFLRSFALYLPLINDNEWHITFESLIFPEKMLFVYSFNLI